MKTWRGLSFWLLFGLTMLVTSDAAASWMVTCDFQTRLLQIKGPLLPAQGSKKAKLPVTLHLLAITYEGGHSDTFCKHTMVLGHTIDVDLQGESTELSALTKGTYIAVNFNKGNSLAGRRAFVWKDWTFQKTFQPTSAQIERWTRKAEPVARVRAAFGQIDSDTKAGKPQIVTIKEAKPGVGFQNSCPIGVRCDEKSPYYAVSYLQGSLWIQLFFQPAVLQHLHLEGLLKHFNYLTLRAEPLPLDFAGWKIHGNRSPHNDVFRQDTLGKAVRLTGFAKGRIQGEIHIALPGLSAVNTRPPCSPPAPGTALADACQASVKGPIPVILRFDLPIRPAIRDCTKGGICKDLEPPTSQPRKP